MVKFCHGERDMKFKIRSNNYRDILTLIVSMAIIPPLITLPLGIRLRAQGDPAEDLSEAYKTVYGIDESDDSFMEDAVAEDWAIQLSDVEVPDMQTLQVKNDYSDIPKNMVSQNYDRSGLPEELLDPAYFSQDSTTYYIKAKGSILKELPKMDSKTLKDLPVGTGVTRTGIGDSWSKIKTEDGTEGYVLTNTITDEMIWQSIDRTVWVDTDSLIVRKEADVNSDTVEYVYRDDPLHCVSVAYKWYKVVTQAGNEGYVYKSYTTQTPPPTPTPTPTPVPTEAPAQQQQQSTETQKSEQPKETKPQNQEKKKEDPKPTATPEPMRKPPEISGKNGQSVVNIAKSMLGVKYRYGGASTSSIDCSGLVMYCYKQIGYDVPHKANRICNETGRSVSRSEIQVGDVICYDYGDHCGHVAIYVGGGRVIHASRIRGRVCYGGMDMMKIRKIKRIV